MANQRTASHGKLCRDPRLAAGLSDYNDAQHYVLRRAACAARPLQACVVGPTTDLAQESVASPDPVQSLHHVFFSLHQHLLTPSADRSTCLSYLATQS